MILNIETGQTVTLMQVRQLHPAVSFPHDPANEALAPFGYARVQPTPQPTGDVVTQGQPEQRDGVWYQTWEVREFTAEELAEREAQRQAETAPLIDAERDRRINEGFEFEGVRYQSRLPSPERAGDWEVFSGKALEALMAIMAGAQPGDLRWSDPAEDFAWIAADNSRVPMDAQTVIELSKAASAHRSRHTFAGRDLKALDPIPADYTDDKYWP